MGRRGRFLTTAALDGSTDRLLAGVGYVLSPGAAAVGFQQFSCKAGVTATLPQGFAVKSPASGDEPDAIFETLAPLTLHPELNEVPVLWPPVVSAPVAPPGDVGSGIQPPPPASQLFPAGSLADCLYAALQAERRGQSAARTAAQARAQAQQLADMMNIVQQAVDDGVKGLDVSALRKALQPICEELCEQQSAAAPPPPAGAPGVLTESQEILARQLKLFKDRRAAALADLEKAMVQGAGSGLVPRVDVTDGARTYSNVVFARGRAADLAHLTFTTNPADKSTVWSVDGTGKTRTGPSFGPKTNPPLVVPTAYGKHLVALTSASGSRTITLEVVHSGPLVIGVGTDEDDGAYAARLAALARFLDALVASLIQDARDQVVLMHGIDALGRLDQAFGDSQSAPQGSAAIGQSALFLLAPGPTAGSTQTLPMIRPGDWFILAEDVDQTDPRGNTTSVRQYRQALPGAHRLRREAHPGERAAHRDPLRSSSHPRLRRPLAGDAARQRHPREHGGQRPGAGAALARLRHGRVLSSRAAHLAARSDRTLRPDASRSTSWSTAGCGPVRAELARSGDGAGLVRRGDEQRRRAPAHLRAGWKRGQAARPAAAAPLSRRSRRDRQPRRAAAEHAGERAPGGAVHDEPAPDGGRDGSRAARPGRADPRRAAHGGRDRSRRLRRRRAGRQGARLRRRAAGAPGPSSRARRGAPRSWWWWPVPTTPRSGTPIARTSSPTSPRGCRRACKSASRTGCSSPCARPSSSAASPAPTPPRSRAPCGCTSASTAIDSPPLGLLDAQNVELHADLRLSSVYGALQGIPGLDSLVVQKLHRSDGPARLYHRIQAGPYELLTWDRPDDGGEGLALDDEEVEKP